MSNTWERSIGDKLAKVYITTKANGSTRPDNVTAVFFFGKPGMLNEHRVELSDPTENCSSILTMARNKLVEKVRSTYEGSKQPLQDMLNFVEKCFDELTC